MKRLFIVSVCFVAAAIVFALPVSASGRRMQQNYSVHITVECLETALETIRDLPGFNLHTNVTFIEPHRGMPVRQAYFTRRVDNWAFRHVQQVLRDMGEVTSESENAWHLSGELSNIETRLLVLSQEIDRLSVMMAASTTLNILIAIDNQLNRVSWERDQLTGRRNQILIESQSTMMTITLSEKTEYIRPAPPTFGRRISDSFLNSWNGLLRMGGNLLVFLTRMSLPYLTWLVLGGLVVFVCLRIKKKKSKNQPTTHTPKEEIK
jgi:hypothetical protein